MVKTDAPPFASIDREAGSMMRERTMVEADYPTRDELFYRVISTLAGATLFGALAGSELGIKVIPTAIFGLGFGVALSLFAVRRTVSHWR